MTNQKVIHMCLTINIQLNWMRFIMISRIIKGKISVISLTWRLRLITLKRPWLFWISQKPQINNCFTIHVHNNPLHLKKFVFPSTYNASCSKNFGSIRNLAISLWFDNKHHNDCKLLSPGNHHGHDKYLCNRSSIHFNTAIRKQHSNLERYIEPI